MSLFFEQAGQDRNKPGRELCSPLLKTSSLIVISKNLCFPPLMNTASVLAGLAGRQRPQPTSGWPLLCLRQLEFLLVQCNYSHCTPKLARKPGSFLLPLQGNTDLTPSSLHTTISSHSCGGGGASGPTPCTYLAFWDLLLRAAKLFLWNYCAAPHK